MKLVSKLDLKFLLSVLNVPATEIRKIDGHFATKGHICVLRNKLCPGDKIPKFDIEELKEEWRKWWMSLKPEWRLAGKSTDTDDTWPMSRMMPGTEAWKKVRKTGPYGVFLALLGLAIWRSASVAGQSSRREYGLLWRMSHGLWARSSRTWFSSCTETDQHIQVSLPCSPRPSSMGLQSDEAVHRTSHPTKRKLGISTSPPPSHVVQNAVCWALSN